MKQKTVLTAAHKAAITGGIKAAVTFLMEDSGKGFTEAVTAIGAAIKAGLLEGTPHRLVTLTEKGRHALVA